jgi:hypothetical protein
MQFSGYGKRVALRLEDVRPHECLPASGVAGTANYLAANPPIARVPRYERITCRDVYPGIDWTVHTTDATLEHDWNLAPGADASAIVLILNEEASATLTDGGDLLFRSGDLSITWKVPKGY